MFVLMYSIRYNNKTQTKSCRQADCFVRILHIYCLLQAPFWLHISCRFHLNCSPFRCENNGLSRTDLKKHYFMILKKNPIHIFLVVVPSNVNIILKSDSRFLSNKVIKLTHIVTLHYSIVCIVAWCLGY